jgi:pyruvate/2-oxoglutarate dehydrogenase complex dihydrolipoamide acyltransferase (E2) component
MRRSVNAATGGEPKLTAMSFLIRAICIAIGKYPVFNASFDEVGRQIIYKDYVNMGIAVDTQRGLIVPVIRNADRLSLRGIAMELRILAERIRSNQFAIEDLRGGTFTVTNVGALGGVYTTPLINYPEVAILGLGRSRKMPVVRGDEITQALILPISLSFDHRVTDGANAARFTREIIGYLEAPAKFLLE